MIYDIESIRIDGQDYTVAWLDMPAIANETIANVDYHKQQITIYKTHEQNDMNSLLHEIMHVVNQNRPGDKLSEAEINSLGCSLTQIVLDNPAELITMASIGLTDDDEDTDDADDEHEAQLML